MLLLAVLFVFGLLLVLVPVFELELLLVPGLRPAFVVVLKAEQALSDAMKVMAKRRRRCAVIVH